MAGITPIDPSMRPLEPIVGINPVRTNIGAESDTGSGNEFKNILVNEIEKLTGMQKSADNMVSSLAQGHNVNLSDVILAVEKVDLSMRFALQLRNKVLDAYQEITRLPV
jgi:flagellar hook-basal body complex protein FliE